MLLYDILRLGNITFHLHVLVEVFPVTTHDREINCMGNISGVFAYRIRAIGASESVAEVCYFRRFGGIVIVRMTIVNIRTAPAGLTFTGVIRTSFLT
jgi:hypothetical protein